MRILLFLLTVAALAQPIPSDHYIATANTTALTLQQPAANARQITFGTTAGVGAVAGASVYCAAAQTAQISWNGTAATATAGSELKLTGTVLASGATVWTASNVGAGTAGPIYNVPAGGTMAFDMTWFRLGTGGTAQNVTITTSGTCTITFAYSAI